MITNPKERIAMEALKEENIFKLSEQDLLYCGFNMYKSKFGHVFEKVGSELIEVTSEELEAEKRYIKRKCNI